MNYGINTMWSRYIEYFQVIPIVLWILIARQTDASLMSNKMRYAIGSTAPLNNLPLEQILDISASMRLENSVYRQKTRIQNTPKFHRGRSLDEEDKSLLENFYRETKRGDPFLDESLNTDSLWKESIQKSRNNLSRDFHEFDKTAFDRKFNGEDSQWSIDPEYIQQRLPNDIDVPIANVQSAYSPTLKLLTSYDPTGLSDVNIKDDSLSGNSIVGATLYGADEGSKPRVSSKSSLDAIKMHQELMKSPPRDGKVRVRMYYHRAIHDDVRLYGNGPWKYWAHGWGLEFGYDPMKQKTNNDFHQKGYTIERAFGRDFCQDRENCRKADPNFFKEPQNVGQYSQQHVKSLAKTNQAFDVS